MAGALTRWARSSPSKSRFGRSTASSRTGRTRGSATRATRASTSRSQARRLCSPRPGHGRPRARYAPSPARWPRFSGRRSARSRLEVWSSGYARRTRCCGIRLAHSGRTMRRACPINSFRACCDVSYNLCFCIYCLDIYSSRGLFRAFPLESRPVRVFEVALKTRRVCSHAVR